MDISKISSISQLLIQISITILPIGAGASSYIAQQNNSSSKIIALGFVWLSLMVFAVSIFLNLSVVRTTEVNTPTQRKAIESKFQIGVSTFVIGIICLILSPVGFATDQLNNSSGVEIGASSKNIEFPLATHSLTETNIVTKIDVVDYQDLPHLRIDTAVSDDTCLSILKTSEQLPVMDGDGWIVSWKITASEKCLRGDYMVIFKVVRNNRVSGQTTIIVKIKT